MELKKHVITGGPCCGKTTTIEALRQRGFPVLEEVSRKVIDEQLKAGGDLVPWKRLSDFNAKTTEVQLENESRLMEGTHFLDRGVIDNLAYCALGGIEPPPILAEAAKKAAYGKVFLLLPLPLYENDPVRKESREKALKLTGLIRKAYHSLGYEVIDVPPVTVDERVEFILRKL